jgi:hypothetical protein
MTRFHPTKWGMNVCHVVGLDADQVDRKKKSAVKRPLGGHATCQGKNGREDLHQAGIPSPRALSPCPPLSVFISSLRGFLVEREGLVCERVTAPTLSLRHSFVGSLSLLLSSSLNV